MSSALRVYTDGGCQPNPGVGGWAVIVEKNGKLEVAASGNERQTTNNRMEMTAAIAALESFGDAKLEIVTDSQYLRNGITIWIRKWKRNNWRTTNRTEVKNSDLWRKIDDLAKTIDVTWRWVRGHADNLGNELADREATRQRCLLAE